MNQHFFSIKNLVRQLFAVGLIALISLPVFATKNKQPIEAEKYGQPTLQIVQSDESSSLLNVQFDTEIPVKYDLIIRDEAGNQVYRKSYETSKISRQFKLVSEPDSNSSKLSVAIQMADGKQFNYAVSNTVNVVKAILVTKL